MPAIVVAGEVLLVAIVLAWKRLDGLDLDVYRLGTQAFFAHGNPYLVLPRTHDGTVLPFTYPPFAALAFAPLLAVSLHTALIALTVISVLALGAVLALCFAQYDRRVTVVGTATLAVQALMSFSEPVRATLGFGQVNLLLMALVAVDTLAPLKQRGYLVGLAAAIKLTPAAFILFFLVRKDFRSAARAAGTFAGCVLVTWVIAPDASSHYWTTLVFQGERVGDPGYIGNQSLRGLIARLGGGELPWAVAAVAVLVLTAFAIRRARHPVPAMLTCGIGALLVSPVSWTHHWVWVAPAIGVLAWHRRWWPAVLATIVFVVSPIWDYPDIWPLRESYVLVGFLLLWLVSQPLDHILDARGQRGDVARLDRGEQADP